MKTGNHKFVPNKLAYFFTRGTVTKINPIFFWLNIYQLNVPICNLHQAVHKTNCLLYAHLPTFNPSTQNLFLSLLQKNKICPILFSSEYHDFPIMEQWKKKIIWKKKILPTPPPPPPPKSTG